MFGFTASALMRGVARPFGSPERGVLRQALTSKGYDVSRFLLRSLLRKRA